MNDAPIITRGGFLRGILAAGVAPAIIPVAEAHSVAGLRRGLALRQAMAGGGGGVMPKYVGIDENNNTPFSCSEFSNGDFEFVITATSNSSWTYSSHRHLLANGETGSGYNSPIGIGVFENNFNILSRFSNASTYNFYYRNKGLINFGTEQSYKIIHIGNDYSAYVLINGVWNVAGSLSSQDTIIDVPIKIGKSNNTGWNWINGGSFNLGKSYLTSNGELLWEGTEGAYERMHT